MKFSVALIFSVLVMTACSETPPDHASNWFYYGKESVVDDMDNTEFIWGSNFASTRGVSVPAHIQDRIGIGDPVWGPRTATVTATNKNNPAISIPMDITSPGGFDSVAITIAHEFKHVDIFDTWGGITRKTGTYSGHTHTDTDALPDSVENDRTAGTIGATYEFDAADPDTFDLGTVYHTVYASYGDNEVLAREEGHNSPRTVHDDKDWSEGGAQWQK